MPRQSSLLRYSGGKSLAADFILSRFPKTQINRYVEPFAGGFTVGLAAIKQDKALNYWLNDYDRGVYAFHYCVKHLNNRLHDRLSRVKTTTALLNTTKLTVKRCKELLKANNTPELLDLATWFYIVNRCSWSGTGLYGGYSDSAAHSRFTHSIIDKIKEFYPLYKDLTITDWDYADILKSYSAVMDKRWLIYADPPYTLNYDLYKGQKSFDHNTLRERLDNISGSTNILISYNDCEYIRDLYKGWYIEDYKLSYGSSKRKQGDELLIRNYKI